MQKNKELCLTLSLVFFILTTFGLLTGALVYIFLIKHDTSSTSSSDNVHEPITTKPDSLMEKREICHTEGCKLSASNFLQSMDKSKDPCINFYDFACGNYANHFHLPEDEESVDAFGSLNTAGNDRIKRLLEESNKDDNLDAVRKAKTFYHTCLNTFHLDELGIRPLQSFLNSIGGWPLVVGTRWSAEGGRSLSEFIGQITRLGFENELVLISVEPDEVNPKINRIQIDQPIPFSQRVKSYHRIPKQIDGLDEGHEATIELIKNIAGALGVANTESIVPEIQQMIHIKEDLQAISTNRNNRINPLKLYNKFTIGYLHQLTQNKIDWLSMFRMLFNDVLIITRDEEVIVHDLEFIKKLPSIFTKYSRRAFTNYIIWEVINVIQEHLDTRVLKIVHDYYVKSQGIQPPPRWKYCITQTVELFQFAVSRLYINAYVDKSVKNYTAELIESHLKGYEKMIRNSEWLDKETRKAALIKSEAITKNIGYPEWIFDDEKLNEEYKDITVSNNHFWNIVSQKQNNTLTDLGKLRTPVDRTEWATEILTANAFYKPELNSINFAVYPFAAPFLDMNTLNAVNYGGLGSVIGHEIGHAFDSEGGYYDEHGALRVWWTDCCRKMYDERAQCFIKQFHAYCPDEMKNMGVCLDGTNTLAENLADDTGLKSSFYAYQEWVKSNGEEKGLPGLKEYSPEQIFFISHAYTNCQNIRPESFYNVYGDDPHSPNKYRVLGVIENSKEFEDVFKCKKNNEAEKCKIW